MSLKKRALSSLLWVTFERFGNQIIGFVNSLILTRLLMPEEFGLLAMISVFIAIGNALINSGLTQSLIRTENPDESDYSTVFYFNLTGSVVIYGIIYLCAPFIADFYDQVQLTSIVRVFSIVFIINAFSAVQRTRLTKLMDFKKLMIVSTPSIIIGGAVSVLLALNGFGVWSLVWSSISQSIASTIQLWYWAKWKPLWVFDKDKFKHHFNFGIKLTFSGLLNSLYGNAYPIIIGKFFPVNQVGFFTRASEFRQRPTTIITSIVNKITYPLFAEIQNDDLRLKSVYKRIMQMVTFLVAPTVIFMGVLAEPIFRFLFTEKWLPAVPYFQILCIAGVFSPLQGYNLQILNVKGRSDLFLKLEIVKKFFMTIIIIISFQFGIYGLVCGVVFEAIIGFFVNSHYSGKFINYNSFNQLKDIIPTIFIALLASLTVYFLDVFLVSINAFDYIRIITGVLGGFITFLFIAWLIKLNSLFELITILQRK